MTDSPTARRERVGFASELVRGPPEVPPKAPTPRVAIRVRGQDGTEVHFRVPRTSDLKKVADAYAQKKGGTPTSSNAYLFIFDGNRIFRDDGIAVTPDDLEMEDGDLIDAILAMRGGGAVEDMEEEADMLLARAGNQVRPGTLNEPPQSILGVQKAPDLNHDRSPRGRRRMRMRMRVRREGRGG